MWRAVLPQALFFRPKRRSWIFEHIISFLWRAVLPQALFFGKNDVPGILRHAPYEKVPFSCVLGGCLTQDVFDRMSLTGCLTQDVLHRINALSLDKCLVIG